MKAECRMVVARSWWGVVGEMGRCQPKEINFQLNRMNKF